MLWHVILWAALLAGAMAVGHRLSRVKRWWLVGFLGPMVIIAGVLAARRVVAASFIWPLGWLVRQKVNWLVMTPTIALLFATLAPRLAQRRQRVAVWIALAAMEIFYGLLPVALPVLVRPALLATVTKLSPAGICLQAHEYTCGPAAAVTALRALGLRGRDADEGTIAAAAGTAPTQGTDPFALTDILNDRFAQRGIRADYVWCGTISTLQTDLQGGAFAVVSINWGVGVNHYVTVLEVNAKRVIVGDPANGLILPMTWEEFGGLWNGAAIVIRRDPSRLVAAVAL